MDTYINFTYFTQLYKCFIDNLNEWTAAAEKLTFLYKYYNVVCGLTDWPTAKKKFKIDAMLIWKIIPDLHCRYIIYSHIYYYLFPDIVFIINIFSIFLTMLLLIYLAAKIHFFLGIHDVGISIYRMDQKKTLNLFYDFCQTWPIASFTLGWVRLDY